LARGNRVVKAEVALTFAQHELIPAGYTARNEWMAKALTQTPPSVEEIVEKWSAGTKSAYCIKSAIQEALALSQKPVVQVRETPITLREAEAERIEWVRRGERAEALNEEFKEKLAEAERQRDEAIANYTRCRAYVRQRSV